MNAVELVGFEVTADNERILMQWSNGKWTEQPIYHEGEEGILCRDLETYISFDDFVEVY